jgi:hypothetical protein
MMRPIFSLTVTFCLCGVWPALHAKDEHAMEGFQPPDFHCLGLVDAKTAHQNHRLVYVG